MRRSVLAVVVALSVSAACSGLHSSPGGAGGGSAGTGGGASSGGGSGTAGGGGSSSGGGGGGGSSSSGGGGTGTAGGQGGGASPWDGGGLLPVLDAGTHGFAFTALALPVAVPSVNAIAGRSADDVWFAADYSILFHYDGQSVRVAHQDAYTGLSFKALHLTATGVLALSGSRIVECDADCVDAGSTSWRSTATPFLQLGGFCEVGRQLLAVGWDGTSGAGSAGVLLKRQPDAGWSRVLTLDATYASACLPLDGSRALIAANKNFVVVTTTDAGSFTQTLEPVPGSNPVFAPEYWHALVAHDGVVTAAGVGRRIARRNGSGQWTLLAQGLGGDTRPYEAVAAAVPGEVEVVGFNATPPGSRASVTAQGIVLAGTPTEALRDVWAADAQRWFFVGATTTGTSPEGVVYRATRTVP